MARCAVPRRLPACCELGADRTGREELMKHVSRIVLPLLVPEGQHVSTAILNQPNGSLIQDLPFSIQLNKFIVDYYSTGMPKLFASDIVVIDHKTGARIPARVEVNEPFEYDGVSIYQ